MNKILKGIAKFFKSIYKLLDKILITPLSRLIYNINEKIKSNSGTIEKVLNKPYFLLYASLAIAIIVFLLVNYKVINLVETEAEIINDQKVNAIYNEEAYVVEGIPNTVDITLIGRKSDLYLAKQLGDHAVTLDLTSYGVGEHKVKLSYTQSIDSLTYKLDPSTVLVVIKEKISTLKTISYDLLNQDKLDSKLSVKNVLLDRSEVVVKGSKETLDKVATVKALVDLNNNALTGAGTFTLDTVSLVAYNETGEIISNVEIVPEKITAEVVLESYSAEVPVKVLTSGAPATGYAIKSLTSSVSKIKIYGDKSVIDNISYVPVTVDVDGLKNDKSVSVTISKPNGIRYMSETSTNVSISLDTENTKSIDNVKIEIKNKNEDYTVTGKSGDSNVSVSLKGVKSVLDDFDVSAITVYIDLSGYGPGNHTIPLQVENTDPRIEVILTTKTMDVVISNK